MSLFSLKKTLSSLSLSFSSALSLSFFDMLCFGCRFVFFFLSFVHFFSYWVRIKRWSSLSLFSLQGEIGNHIIRLSLSLSLTKSARFGKPDLPLECSAGTQKERGMIISEKEEIDSSDKLARESRKKKMDWISLLIAAREPQPQRVVVASKTKTHNPRTNLGVLPSVRPRGACLQNSFFLRCFNIYIYVCIFYQISLTNAFVHICALLCSKTHEDKL